MSQIRINKYLTAQGFCSRRVADELIREGVVSINGRAASLGDQVGPDDVVHVRDTIVATKNTQVYIKLHKPPGITTTTEKSDPDNIIDFVNHPKRIFPIGRLDKYSSGLILLTDDGEIVNKVLRSRYEHEKEYIVKVDRPFDQAFLTAMSSGVDVLGRPTLPAQVSRLGARTFKIVLTEGRNRQIRRMCEALEYRVAALKRVRIMNIELGDLPIGQWRDLTPEELKGLFARIDAAEARAPGDEDGTGETA